MKRETITTWRQAGGKRTRCTKPSKGGWNSRSEATKAAGVGFAIDSAKDKIQDENEIPSDQKPPTYTAKQLENARITSEPQRLRERKHMSHEMTTW